MRKASPAVHIPALSKAAVAAAEAAPSTSAHFTDIETSAAYIRDGVLTQGNIRKAAVPNWQLHDTGRVVFGNVAITGALTGLSVELWSIDAQGIPVRLGVSVYTAGGFLPPISFPIAGRNKYAIRVSVLTFTDTGTVGFPVFVQGYYKDADDA